MLIAMYTVAVGTFVWFKLSMNKGDQKSWSTYHGDKS